MEEPVANVKYLVSETRGKKVAFYSIVTEKPAFFSFCTNKGMQTDHRIGIFVKEQKVRKMQTSR